MCFFGSYPLAMEVRFTADQEAFIRQAIEAGRLHRVEDAVQEALSLWEERERKRVEFMVSLDEAEGSLAQGNGRRITVESMRELADEVHERGMTRLAADKSSPR